MARLSEKKRSRIDLWIFLLVAGGSLLAIAIVLLSQRRSTDVSIGVEGRLRKSFPGPELAAVPYTHGDAMAVRIASAERAKDGFRYDLRYMAYGPGEHDLRQYLVGRDGKPALNLPDLFVRVDPLLPNNYSGELFETPAGNIEIRSNYLFLISFLWGAWICLLVPLVLYGRTQTRDVIEYTPPPTTAERLRRLLSVAEEGPLQVEQEAELEKLLLTFWAEELHENTDGLANTVARLREHPIAGPQIQLVERWLHGRDHNPQNNVAAELLSSLGRQDNLMSEEVPT